MAVGQATFDSPIHRFRGQASLLQGSGGGQARLSTTPPSTRNAAPVVAEACGEAT